MSLLEHELRRRGDDGPAPAGRGPAGRAGDDHRQPAPRVAGARGPGLLDADGGLETAVLVVLVWATAVLPRLLQTLLAPKYRTTVGDGVPLTAASQLLERGLTALALGWCVVVVLVRLHALPGTGRRALAACLVPWVYLLVRAVWAGTTPHALQTWLYPAVVVAVWALRPPVRRLALLGWLCGATAVVSVLLGVVLPAKGIYHGVTGAQVTPDKQILPWGILIGPLTDGNNLGQLLVLGTPAITLVPRRAARWALLAVSALGIVWTSSRSSIGALAVLVLLSVALRLVRPASRSALSACALVALGALMVALPLVTSDPAAFTNRGRIWIASRAAWQDSFLTGTGPQWFTQLARYSDGLGGYAFHGHNQFVQTFVSGGVLAVLSAGLVLALVGVRAAVLAAGRDRAALLGVLQVAVFLVSSTLEVSFGFLDRAVLLEVTALPLAVVLFAPSAPAAPAPRAPGR